MGCRAANSSFDEGSTQGANSKEVKLRSERQKLDPGNII